MGIMGASHCVFVQSASYRWAHRSESLSCLYWLQASWASLSISWQRDGHLTLLCILLLESVAWFRGFGQDSRIIIFEGCS